MAWLLSVFALVSVTLVHASPIEVKRQDITTLSPTQVDAFAQITHFASAAYCDSSITRTWNCGSAFTHCPTLERLLEPMLPQPIVKRFRTLNQLQLEATAVIPSFVSEQTTTDAVVMSLTPSGYVGSSPSLNTVIVAHQGTDPKKL
jgi:hypothetical protein